MAKFKNKIFQSNSLSSDIGASAVEYALVLALVSVIAIGAITGAGGSSKEPLIQVAMTLDGGPQGLHFGGETLATSDTAGSSDPTINESQNGDDL